MVSNILKTNEFESILLNKASGSWIWDINGNKYLDCESGMWCCNLGHNHPKVIRAIKDQLDKIVHRNKSFLTPITLEAAEKVLEYIPDEYDRITFLNSGSEAMEFGIDFSKKVTNRTKILSLQDSYLGAYGTAKESSYTSKEDSKLKIAYPVCNSDDCSCLDIHKAKLDEIFTEYLSQIACFILEPIMVGGGVHKPCTQFIQFICKEIQASGGLVLIDEVTTGFGRTGTKFGYENFQIKPDIIVLGKALGNGYPVSAIITNSHLESKISSSELYYAQSHQLDPLGATVAKSVIEVFEEEQIIEKSQNKINQLKSFFGNLEHPCIKEIRSFGMVFAIQLQPYKNMSTKELVYKIKDTLLEEGILIGFNATKGLLRFLPPLKINDNEISFFKQKMSHLFNSI